MSPITGAVLGLLPAVWPFHAPQVVTRDYTLPVWQFSMAEDRFTGSIQCRLYQGRRKEPTVSYGQHSLVFHLDRRLNTFGAEYRLDGGPAKRWQDLYPKVIESGATLDGGSMANPTGGLVIMPISELAGVHTVTIRVTPISAPRTFSIDGYSDAIEAARVRGCKPEAAFVR